MVIELFFIIIVLILFGVFAASEASIFSLESSSLQKKLFKSSKNIRRVLSQLKYWVENPEEILIPILLANIFLNIIFIRLFEKFLASQFPMLADQTLFPLIFITMMIIFWGEILPKTTVLSYAKKWSLWIAPFLMYWSSVVRFISVPAHRFLHLILKNFFPEDDTNFDEKKLLETLEQAYIQGILSQTDMKKLEKYIVLYTNNVYSIMLPKEQNLIVYHDSSVREIQKTLLEQSKKEKIHFVLVYDSTKNQFIGYLRWKHLLLISHKKHKAIARYIQPLSYIPSTMSLIEALEKFVDNNQEIGLVLGEDGQMTGTITVKYILEALIGDPVEKLSSPHFMKKFIKENRDGTYTIAGNTKITLLNQLFSLNLYSDIAKTVNGLIIHTIDGFPNKHTVVEIGDCTFSKFVMSKKSHQIVKAQMKLKSQK